MMITPRLRPRLEMRSTLTPDQIAEHLQDQLTKPNSLCRGLVRPHQADIRIRAAERRFWSPQLNVIIRAQGNSTTLTGHFGPNSNVWTMFMAAYGFIILSGITGLFFGISQLIIGSSPWALISAPLAVILVLLIYVAAGFGQRLGHDQTDTLQHFLEDALSHNHTPESSQSDQNDKTEPEGAPSRLQYE